MIRTTKAKTLLCIAGLFALIARAEAQISRSVEVRENRSFVYHGKLVRPDGSTPTGSIPVTLKVFSPDPSLCLLWSESQIATVTNGAFAIEIGHTVNRLSGGNGGAALNFKQVFVNNPGLTIPSANCQAGSSYTPSLSDDRLLTALFNDGGSVIEIAGMPMKSVPFALQAEEIGGFGLTNLMKINGASNVTFAPAEVQTLKDLLGGDVFFDMKSRRVTKVGTPTASDDAATKAYVDTAIAGVSGGGGTAITSGDVTSALGFTPISDALATGQVYLGVAGVATASNFGIGQLRNNVGAPQMPTACSASQTLTYSAVTDVLACTNIAISSGAVSGLGGLADNNSVDLSTAEVAGTLPTAKIADKAVTLPKLQDIPTNTLLGRATASTGAVEQITIGSGLQLTGTTLSAVPGSSGTVTSVDVTVPAYMSATGGPIANAGAIALGFNSQAQNSIFAGPATGGAGAASFRGLAASDIPALDAAKISTGTFAAAQIPSLDASKINAGTLPITYGGTGLVPVVGDANKLYGMNAGGTGSEFKTITATGNVTVTHTANTITVHGAAGGGGTVTEVFTGGAPLSVSNGTNTPTISIAQANTTTAGYLSAADWNTFNGKQPAGAYLTSISSGNVTTALGFTPVSNVLATGQVYLGVGNVATASNFGIGQMRNNVGTLQMPTSCAASQTLTWSAVTDVLVCSNIDGLNADKITAGTLNTARLGSGTADNTKYLRGDSTWQTLPSGADDLGNHTATTNVNLGAHYISRTGTAAGLSLDASNNATFSGTVTATTFNGSGANLTNIPTAGLANNAVTGAKFRQSAALSVVGNGTNATADVTDLAGTANQVLRVNAAGTALGFGSIDLSTASVTGTLPAARMGSGTPSGSNFLRGDGTWASIPGSADNMGDHAATTNISLGANYLSRAGTAAGLSLDASNNATFSGTVTATSFSGSGANLTNIPTAGLANNAVTDAKLRQGVARSIIGVTGNATANVADIQGTANQILRVDSAGTGLTFGSINLASSAAVSGVLAPANMGTGTADNTKYLRGDGTWQTLPAGADNLGSHTATMNLNLATFKLVGNGGSTGISIDAAGNVGVGTTSPSERLEVGAGGKIKAPEYCIGASCITAWPSGNYLTGLTGDVVATGPGSVGATIQANAVTTAKIADGNVTTVKINDKAVTFAKLQDVATNRILGRSTAGAGAPEELQIGTGLSLSGGTLTATNTNAGTVTSVGVSVPAYMTSTGGAITSSGTIALDFAGQTTNKVFAAPDGSTGAPSFRALVSNDIPSLNTSKLNAGTLSIARGGTGISASGVIGDANKVFGIDAAGAAGELKTITQGSGVTVTHGAGTITIAATGSGGTVTNVGVGGLPLSVVNGSSTPTISIAQANTTTAGFLTAADWNTFNGKQPAGAYLTETLPTNQVFIGDGSSVAAAGFFGIGQMRNNLGTLQMPTACASSQTLTWSAVNDVLACSNISGLDADKITAGTFATARLGSGTANATVYLRGDGTWAAIPSSADDLGNHTATQNLNLASYQLVGNGGSAGISIDSSGNVGVGTSSPMAAANMTSLSLNGTNSGVLEIQGGGTQRGALWYDTTASLLRLRASGGAGKLAFDTASVDRMTIDSIGRVGIGTTSPGYSLDLVSGNTGISRFKTSSSSSKVYFEDSGSGTNNVFVGTSGTNLLFGANGSESMRLTSSGNLGIGTTSPAATLDVAGAINATGFKIGGSDLIQTHAATGLTVGAWYRLAQTNSTVSQPACSNFRMTWAGGSNGSSFFNACVTYSSGTGTTGFINVLNHTSDVGNGISALRLVYDPSALTNNSRAYVEYYSTAATGVTIEAFDMAGVATNHKGWALMSPSTAGSIPGGFSTRQVTLAAGGLMSASGNLHVAGSVGVGTAYPGVPLDILNSTPAGFGLRLTGNSATGWPAASMAFSDVGAGGRAYAIGSRNGTGFSISDESAGATRMVINSSGQVGIGNISPGYLLDVLSTGTSAVAKFKNMATSTNPVAIFASANSTTCALSTAGNISCSSDVRLKKDIAPIDDALEGILKLDGVRYHLLDEGATDALHVGFKAQQLKEVYPELVRTDENGYYQVSYAPFVAVIVQAIKELYGKWLNDHEKIERLEESNLEKQRQIDQLKGYLCLKDSQAPFCN